MTAIKWYNRLGVRLLLGFLILVLFISFLAGFTLLRLGQHARDPDILYRVGEILSSVDDVSNITLELKDKTGTEKTYKIAHKLSEFEFDLVTKQLDEMIAGNITSLLSDNRPEHVNLNREELQLLTNIREQWDLFQMTTTKMTNKPLEGATDNTHLLSMGKQLQQLVETLALTVHKRIDREMHEVTDELTWIMVSLSLTLLSMFGWLFFRLFRPLQGLSRKLTELEQGHLDVQFAEQRKDEIGQLTGALQYSLQRLHCLSKLSSKAASVGKGADMVPFIEQQLSQIMPVESVALLRMSSDRSMWVCEVVSGHDLGVSSMTVLSVNDEQATSGMQLEKLLAGSPASTEYILGEVLSRQLAQVGLQSVLLLPMTFGSPMTALILLGCSSPNAYTQADTDLVESSISILQGSFQRSDQLEAMMLVAVSGLARLAESRDPETGDHLLRMGRYSAIIADTLNREGPYRGMISQWHASALTWLAPLHDIGKVGIEDTILLKPGRLNDEERKVMEQHSVIGGEVLHDCHLQVSPFGVDIFELAEKIAVGHHEKYNGSGYPKGLKGDDIPLVARIVAVADVFDALTSKRPYKEAWPVEGALEWMRKQSGSHFDPVVVAAFESSMPRIMEVYEKYKHR